MLRCGSSHWIADLSTADFPPPACLPDRPRAPCHAISGTLPSPATLHARPPRAISTTLPSACPPAFLPAGPSQLAQPGYPLRSGFLATLAYYLLVHVAGVLTRAEGRGLVISVFVAYDLAAGLTGLPMDYTAPFGKLFHTVRVAHGCSPETAGQEQRRGSCGATRNQASRGSLVISFGGCSSPAMLMPLTGAPACRQPSLSPNMHLDFPPQLLPPSLIRCLQVTLIPEPGKQERGRTAARATKSSPPRTPSPPALHRSGTETALQDVPPSSTRRRSTRRRTAAGKQ